MEVVKILNNNAAIAKDKNGQEFIVMGKGIAFNKKKGSDITQSLITKTFTLQTNEMNQFSQMISSIDLDVIELTYQIITQITTQNKWKLKDSLYITLADHISSAIQRYHQGIVLNNILLMDIKRFYSDEFKIGIELLHEINQHFKIKLPIDEAAFMAMHFVEGRIENNQIQIQKITTLISELSKIVKYYFKIEFDTQSIYYSRFISHLKFFAQRILTKQEIESKHLELLEIIKEQYAEAYKCSLEIKKFLQKKYLFETTNEELLYLTVQIQRITLESKKQ